MSLVSYTTSIYLFVYYSPHDAGHRAFPVVAARDVTTASLLFPTKAQNDIAPDFILRLI